jgi:hypothetical protein
MRSTAALGLLVGMLSARTAMAAGGGPGGGGTAASGAFSASGGGPGAANPDVVAEDARDTKPWQVVGLWESHRVIRQAESAGASKQFNVFGLEGRYDITAYDRVRVRMYLYERFLSDSGETGLRFDDIILQYTRRIPLPQEFTLRPSLWVTAPTSFVSQKEGMITAPRAILDLEKKFGPYVTASVRTHGGAYIAKYRTAGDSNDPASGGNPNKKYDLRFAADVEVAMPFHTPLSIGIDVATGYAWYYEPNTTNDPNPSVQQNGVAGDAQFSQQPIQQTYAGEIFVRYALPRLFGVQSDLLVAFANGDPSLGSVSVLHDGVGHLYFGYRQTAEVYGTLTLRY